MARVIIIIAIVALTIYCTVEVAQAKASEVRRMPKWLWAALVIAAPVIGPVLWLLFGRPIERPRGGGSGGRRPPIAPDDNPDFLRSL